MATLSIYLTQLSASEFSEFMMKK